MKKVFSNSNEVAHRWANRLQESARSSTGHFYFYDDTIYSYGSHFPIAKHFNGNVLFTTQRYSNTTAKHIRMVSRAASHLDKIYCEYIPYSAQDKNTHQQNISYWLLLIEENAKKLQRAHKPEYYVEAINEAKRGLFAYVDFFKLKLTKAQNKIATMDDASWKDLITKRNEAEKARIEKIRKQGKPLYDKAINEWHNNENKYPVTLTDKERSLLRTYEKSLRDVPTYLRITGDKINTSKGVDIPLNVAHRFYKWYLRTIDNGGCDGNCKETILGYEVKSASADRLIVGCHNIERAEIDRIANELGW